MKIICLQKKLNQAIIITEKIIGKSFSLPVLDNLLLTTEKNFLKISSTDLELGISIWIPIKLIKEGSISIPAKLIKEYISNLPNEKIELESKNNNLLIKCKNYKAIIKGVDPKDYPLIPQIKEGIEYLEIGIKDFINGLSMIIETTSNSETQIEISGIFINFFKNNIKFVATDSFRLAEKSISFSQAIKKQFSIILPKKTAQ